MSAPRWQPAEFSVRMGWRGDQHAGWWQAERGFVCDIWGLSHATCRRPSYWTVTHLPTGHVLGTFTRRRVAEAVVRAVTPLCDWDAGPLTGTPTPPVVSAAMQAVLDRMNGRIVWPL